MKRYLILLLAIFACVSSRASETADRLFDAGNTAYVNSDYRTAIEYYDSIENMGLQSAKLYYNMGNAYFKAGKIGAAVLYYNKALLLAPTSKDIEHNLAVANSYTRDNNIESVPRFFASRWVVALRSSLSSNVWAVFSIVFFVLLLSGLLLYLLPVSLRLRKAGLGLGIVSIALFILTAVFASAGRREALNPTQAIVMISAAPVKSSPDASSRDLFILHEGAKITVTDALNDWREIMIADGHKGWISASSIELID